MLFRIVVQILACSAMCNGDLYAFEQNIIHDPVR